MVLQTLSKAFGLAGIRLGIAIANPDIINYMMNVKAPYNVNKLTSQAALNGFENLESVQKNIGSINSEKNRIVAELENLAHVEKVFPSDANFLLFRVDDALNVYKKLADSGVIVRYRGNEPHCENCLRMTIGTTQENDQFLSSLIKILG